MNEIRSNSSLDNIKSNFIFKKIFLNLHKYKSLRIIKYNKKAQKRLNIDINDYDEFSKIEIEIIHSKKKFQKFVNIPNNEKESYFHVYFDDNEKKKKNMSYLMMKINLIKLK